MLPFRPVSRLLGRPTLLFGEDGVPVIDGFLFSPGFDLVDVSSELISSFLIQFFLARVFLPLDFCSLLAQIHDLVLGAIVLATALCLELVFLLKSLSYSVSISLAHVFEQLGTMTVSGQSAH